MNVEYYGLGGQIEPSKQAFDFWGISKTVIAGVTNAANVAPPTRIDRREGVFFLPAALG